MPRGASSFKQQDITRALRAAIAAGVDVARVELEGGRIIIVAQNSSGSVASEVAAPLDAWRAGRDNR